VQPDGRYLDVVLADVHGIKRTLHAYAEKSPRVRGREIIVFLRYTKMNKVSSMDTDTLSRVTRTEQGHDDGAIFVSNFPSTTTQEELSEVERKYKQFMMRMPFALLSLKQVGFLSGFIIISPGSGYAYFVSYIPTGIMSRKY
jgi:hypothetical protein